MKNYVQKGDSLEYLNESGSDIASGDAVVIGSQIGVAAADIVDDDSGTVNMEGVYTLPKTTGSAIAQGDPAIFDVSVAEFIPSTGTPAVGDVSGAVTCWADAASGDTTVAVKINTGVGVVATE